MTCPEGENFVFHEILIFPKLLKRTCALDVSLDFASRDIEKLTVSLRTMLDGLLESYSKLSLNKKIMSSTMAVQVRYKSRYIYLSFSAKKKTNVK